MLAKALESLENLRIPTIAAVQGSCMGGGFELALSCDLIVSGRSARFAFPEARVGLMTLQGGVIQLTERIGRSKAIELVLFSHVVGARQMKTWNVVNRVFDDAHLAADARAMAQSLAVGPTSAYASTKDLLRTWKEEGAKGAKAAVPAFDARLRLGRHASGAAECSGIDEYGKAVAAGNFLVVMRSRRTPLPSSAIARATPRRTPQGIS
jgi:enoyl-CoA hydratase/carnithine racemase